MERYNKAFKTIEVKLDQNTLWLTLNRPEMLNALNRTMFREMETVFKEVASDSSVTGMVITGKGRAFAAGADLEDMYGADLETLNAYSAKAEAVFQMISDLEIPVIAAVNGYALGGGCELAMACDIRIASENAVFAQPEVGLGAIPCFGGTQRLPRIVGQGMASELIFTGRNVKAEEAARIGLINQIVPAEQLTQSAMDMMHRIQKNAPKAVGYAKRAITGGMNLSILEGLALENNMSSLDCLTEDYREGMAAFIEKRKPVFKNK